MKQYQSGSVEFKLFNLPENALVSAEGQIEEKFNGEVKLKYVVNGKDYHVTLLKNNATEEVFDQAVKSFINTFSKFIYANEDISLAKSAVQLLKLHGYKLSSAESFTGGAIAREIVGVAGASEVFYEGLVCYNTNAKIQRLGVDPQTVKQHTVVSREVAFEMVNGLLESGNCDIAVATTGYASPVENNPSLNGLCFVAVGNAQKIEVFRYKFLGEREQIIKQGKDCALFAVIKLLRG